MNSDQRRARRRAQVGVKGLAPMVDFNQPQMAHGDDADRVRLEFWIAKQIGTDLAKVYPNWQWLVDVDTRNEVIVIQCPSLSKRKGYHIHIKRDTVAQLIPRCRAAAAEILERYNVPRSRIIDPDTMESFERDVRDDVKDTVDSVETPMPSVHA